MRRATWIRHSFTRLRRLLAPAALVAGLLIVAGTALGRAGGGEGYSGGGGGGGGFGGGGSGGDGGGGDLLFLLIRLIIYYPKIGIPVLIVVIVFVIYGQRKGAYAYQGSVLRRGHALISNQQRQAMVAALRESDAAFDEPAFIARVTRAFRKIQTAWSIQDLQPVRPFISDAVYERFSLQFDEQRMQGYRNVMEDVSVSDARIVQVESDRVFDTLSVRIAASAKDYRMRLADGSRIRGSERSGPFVEVWSFLRRRGTRTDPAKPGLMEGRCPNCGAGLAMNQNADCAHCGALLRSGQYDWVLAEITQEFEWSAHRSAYAAPGVAEMMGRDPGFNLQDLEDRASVMFWRRATAERTGSVQPLRKIASEDFIAVAEEALRGLRENGRRQYVGDCAVGAVQTLGIVGDAEWDRALVEVRWSGRTFVMDDAARGGQPSARGTGEAKVSRTVFELSRRTEVKSDLSRAISSAHCPNCGAPEEGGTSAECAFCGVTLNDGRHGWVLTAVRSVQEARERLEAGALVGGASSEGYAGSEQPVPVPWAGGHDAPSTAEEGAEILDGQGDITAPGVLAWMASVAAVDGEIDARERGLIARVGQRRKVPPERLEVLLAAATQGQLDLPMPADRDQARRWLGAMTSAALADGNVSRDEYTLLLHTGQRLGMGDYDIRLLINRTRTEALERARGALRASRNRPLQ